jgi:hypothetical protein
MNDGFWAVVIAFGLAAASIGAHMWSERDYWKKYGR